MSIFLHWVEGYCWHCCTLKALLCLLWSKLFLWSHVVTNCSVEIFQNECIWFLRSREHHVSVCASVCHSSSAYFHGYRKTGWSMKACLLQTSWCALITALCASYPAVMGERWTERAWPQSRACGRRGACMAVKIQQEVEHKGMKKGWEMVSGWKTAVGLPIRDTQHDNGDTLMKRQQRHRMMQSKISQKTA